MFLRIQRGAAVPISRQIEGQIRAQILAGSLAPEDQLPSVRQLARELAVNVNTVLRVYERLASDGLIELRHGEGTYVTRRAKGGTAVELAEKRRELAQELEALVRRGLMLGLTPDELNGLVADALDRVAQSAAGSDQLAAGESISGAAESSVSNSTSRRKTARS